MPVSLSFTEPSTFLIDASGVVTYAECICAVNELLAHSRLQEDARILVDARSIVKTLNTDELRALAHALEGFSERGIHSIAVVTSSAFIYGVTRMFSVFAQVAGIDVSVFKDMDEAQRWLSEAQPPEPS